MGRQKNLTMLLHCPDHYASLSTFTVSIVALMDSTHARHEAEYSDFGSVQEKRFRISLSRLKRIIFLRVVGVNQTGGKKLFKFNIFFTEIVVLRTIMEN